MRRRIFEAMTALKPLLVFDVLLEVAEHTKVYTTTFRITLVQPTSVQMGRAESPMF
jgi:hypothetical protein